MATVQFKLLDDSAELPTPNPSGWDIYSFDTVTIPPGRIARVTTQLAIGIPKGYVGMLYERMGVALKHPYKLICPIIHHGFYGEVSLMIHNLGDTPLELRKYDRIAQLIVVATQADSIITAVIDTQFSNKIGGHIK